MGISGLLDSARQALNAQSAAIRILGDNIANVNTEGYSRRRADIVSVSSASKGGLDIGGGVNVDRVVRMADKFVNAELVRRLGDRAQAEIKSEFLTRAESVFQLDGDTGRIGAQLNEFFSALQDLTISPANIPLRTQVIQKGNDLAVTINETYNSIAQLQRETDDRVGILVQDINRLSASIAQTNAEISKSETSGNEALTLRDQRDKLVEELGEKVSFTTITDSSGQYTLILPNGYYLVSGGRANTLGTTTTPTFAPVGGFPLGLDGTALKHVTYNIGGTDVDLTATLRSGSGELSGLLKLRGTQSASDTSAFDANGSLVDVATRIEALARDLLVRFNLEYRGPDADTATAGYTPSAYDLNGNQPGVYGLFSFVGATAANNLGDADGNGLASNADLNAIIASGTVASYARNLTFNVGSERSFAASRDLDLATSAVSVAQGDASNVAGLLAQRNATNAYSLGSLSETTDITGLYGLTVSYVGGISARARDDFSIFKDRETQVRELQKSFSGVNLDEEFAQLVKFQQAFQAASRLIRTGSELTDEIIGLIG